MGRRKDVDGRELLLAAALSLFATHGVDAVSIRAVNRAAGLGPASVHYHFGTKEALLDAVVQMHNDAVVERVTVRAREIAAAAADTITAHDLVQMLAAPYVSLVDDATESGASWVQLVSQLLQSDPNRFLVDPAVRLTWLAAATVYPNADPGDIQRAMRMCFTLLLTQLALAGSARNADFDLDLLLEFLSAGLDATLSEDAPPSTSRVRRAQSA